MMADGTHGLYEGADLHSLICRCGYEHDIEDHLGSRIRDDSITVFCQNCGSDLAVFKTHPEPADRREALRERLRERHETESELYKRLGD